MKAGDTVVATKEITRVDKRVRMAVGDTAKVISVYDGPVYQIMNIELPDGNQMVDICCRHQFPLKVT